MTIRETFRTPTPFDSTPDGWLDPWIKDRQFVLNQNAWTIMRFAIILLRFLVVKISMTAHSMALFWYKKNRIQVWPYNTIWASLNDQKSEYSYEIFNFLNLTFEGSKKCASWIVKLALELSVCHLRINHHRHRMGRQTISIYSISDNVNMDLLESISSSVQLETWHYQQNNWFNRDFFYDIQKCFSCWQEIAN